MAGATFEHKEVIKDEDGEGGSDDKEPVIQHGEVWMAGRVGDEVGGDVVVSHRVKSQEVGRGRGLFYK